MLSNITVIDIIWFFIDLGIATGVITVAIVLWALLSSE